MVVSVYQLKNRFQALLRPLVGRLAQSGVTANQVTIAAMALSVAVGLWLVFAPEAGPGHATEQHHQ